MSWFDGILAEGIGPVSLVIGLFAAALGSVWLLRARLGASSDQHVDDESRISPAGARIRPVSGVVDISGVGAPGHGNGDSSAAPAVVSDRWVSPSDPPTHDQVFEVLRRLGPGKDLGHVLQGIVDAIGEEFGFSRVVLRVYNPRTRLFEARAFHGCDEDLIHRISNVDVSLEEWAGMARRADRLGNSHRVPVADDLWPDRLGQKAESESEPWTPESVRQAGLDRTGRPGILVVPMNGEEGDVLGYLALAEAEPTTAPAVANLEILAFQAVLALETSRLRSRLKRRELEYSVVSEQLKDWQATRDNFVANVSHELRTPLTSIKAYAETLERSHSDMDDTTRREFVDVILREAERLNQVFDDLLDVAHMEGGRRRIVRDRVDLSATIEDACEHVAPRFAEKRVKLHSDLPSDPLLVQGDGEGLRQVVTNLLSNALKFTPEGGAVVVVLREDTGTARVTVEDTGIGIPEHELSRIFERFYQVDGSSTRAYGGQGLGLSICKDVVGWHHGRIWAENRAEGGARFVFTLPVRGLVVRQSPSESEIDGAERLQWEAFLRLSTTLVAEVLGTRVASIMLVDEFEEVLRIEAAVGLDEEIVQNGVVSRGEGVAGTVWRHGHSVLVPDLDADERFQGLADNTTYRPRSLLSVPLWWEERVIGVVNVNSKANGRPFDEDDRLLLEALAERVVLALESFERYRSGYRRLASVESGVRAMLDVGRDRRTHLREMLVRCGVQTGRELGLDEVHLRALAYALRTYDLGLAQVSTQILRKVSPLTREERARIEDHVQLGAELIADLEPSPRVKKIILHHHENVDGSGYPDGLKGEAIPIGARVVRLVDALSALLHDRPFRPAMRLDEAIDLLREGVDRRFCPRVTPVFLSIVLEHEALVHSLHPRARRDGGQPAPFPLEDLRIREH